MNDAIFSTKILPILLKTKKITGKVVRFLLKFFMVFFIVLFVLGCIAGGYVGLKVMPKIEEYKQLAYDKFDSIGPNTFTYLSDTVIYDKNGDVLTELNVGNYEYVKIDNVSNWVQEGYIAVEDKKFKVHNGIDYKALVRATLSLVKNKGEITQGGSTITQQVLKNNLLTQEKTFARKLTEFFLAPEFEKKYSKKEIMEFYVNTNFYGNNCYGIEAASQYYFGKSAADLTIGESALFVGMSNNATLYNPKKNYDGVMSRWKFVLGEMLEENVITQEEYDTTLEQGLTFVYTRENRGKEDYLTSYAIHCSILELMKNEDFEFKYLFVDEKEYNDYRTAYTDLYNELGEKIRAGGYKIYTSLDVEMQDKLQKIVDKNTSGFNEKQEDGRYAFQTAAVVVNNETGYVEAIVGGRGTDDEYNRGFLAKRQPGSSIKPLVVYAPAFNSGLYFPSLIMNDKDDPNDKYYPRNYSGNFLGNMSIREAVGRSTNTIAYQIMKSIGANNGLEYLAKMRFDTMSNVDNNNTAVALGGFTYGVRVSDMAKGYSTLVNGGEYIDNSCIIKIEYQNEGEVFHEKSERVPVYEADAAYMMIDCCKTVLYQPYGTSVSRRPNNAIVMGKSGTTNNHKDAWFCGSSVYYSMAVWSGYDTPRSTNLTGGSLPGKIWQQMMQELHKGKEQVDFERPETVINKPITHNGNIANYNSGIYDMFSQTLLDKAEAERKAIKEQKKIAADNQLIGEIDIDLNNLRTYVIQDIDALTYLTSRFTNLDDSISNVYQTEQKTRLETELSEIEEYYAIDIRNMKQLNVRNKAIEDAKSDIANEKVLVEKLNNLNAYVVTDRKDISIVEGMYKEIDKLLKNSKNTVKDKYTPIYNEIVGYKEILLKPYRDMIEEEKHIEREEAESLLQEYLAELGTYNIYESALEALFIKIEQQMEVCESLDIDISDYYADYVSEKEFILRTKPQPEIPPVRPSIPDEEEQENTDKEEDIEKETENDISDSTEEIEESHIVDEHYSGNVYINYGKNKDSKLNVSN